jgi:hypothetical protein
MIVSSKPSARNSFGLEQTGKVVVVVVSGMMRDVAWMGDNCVVVMKYGLLECGFGSKCSSDG